MNKYERERIRQNIKNKDYYKRNKANIDLQKRLKYQEKTKLDNMRSNLYPRILLIIHNNPYISETEIKHKLDPYDSPQVRSFLNTMRHNEHIRRYIKRGKGPKCYLYVIHDKYKESVIDVY